MIIKSSLTVLNFMFTYEVIAFISVVDTGVLKLQENSVGIRFFVDITNENRQRNCSLRSECKRCCLIDAKKQDCDVMTAFGENIEMLKPRDRKTLLYVAPMLLQHDLVGFCDITLNYSCNNTEVNTVVTIPYDTRVDLERSNTLLTDYVGCKKVTKCHTTDEDSLKRCEPVNCDRKYFDMRPFFDHNVNKCVEVPICLTNLDKELPDYVYLPSSNICRNLNLPLTVQDIYIISSGLGVVTINPVSTLDMKVKIKSNCSTISQNLKLLRDLIYGKLSPLAKGVVLDYSDCLKSVFIRILRCIISLCSILFLLVCCVNSVTWLYLRWVDGQLRKMWNNIKSRTTRARYKRCKRKQVNSNRRNSLLREVIVKDIPLGLRNSVIDVCERMGKEVGKRRRYRKMDIGSQISLQKKNDIHMSSLSSTSLEYEKE